MCLLKDCHTSRCTSKCPFAETRRALPNREAGERHSTHALLLFSSISPPRLFTSAVFSFLAFFCSCCQRLHTVFYSHEVSLFSAFFLQPVLLSPAGSDSFRFGFAFPTSSVVFSKEKGK